MDRKPFFPERYEHSTFVVTRVHFLFGTLFQVPTGWNHRAMIKRGPWAGRERILILPTGTNRVQVYDGGSNCKTPSTSRSLWPCSAGGKGMTFFVASPSLHCQVTVKWLPCPIVSCCIALYHEISKHKGLCKGRTWGDTASNAPRSLQGLAPARVCWFNPVFATTHKSVIWRTQRLYCPYSMRVSSALQSS